MSLCQTLGTLILITGLASGAVLSLLFSLSPPRQTAVIALSLLFFFAHSGSLVFFLFNPSVKPLPHRAGKSVFSYCFAWITFQIAGFACMQHGRWRHDLPGYLAGWAVAWEVLSVSTMAFFTGAVFLVFLRRACVREHLEAVRRSRVARCCHTRDEEMAYVEHIEFSPPPPVYKPMPYLESYELKH
ncbi:hypothetical protein CkaCkLH20_09491 [Colletotrichum karsti]|uniref:Uncharacterized protein n=1 Tax=Colletotrichum karsti TaxID=1095194 RepID=A0A9P6I170_9PEZI|nr:uncharacterized protein CkaCkLH20_09491 [Colletotrichum karsti]KAF9872981.1 hypothetical protein CkaCkLH20_09491 [Colletotrichum karsti]